MSDLKYTPCPYCLDKRKALDPNARHCRRCEGSGFVLLSYVCNGCGETIRDGLGIPEINYQGSYKSWHLCDLTSYKFGLCERCLRELFDRMTVPPTVCSYGRGNDEDAETYAENRAAYQQRLDRIAPK